jgi:uncharacterized protein (TIGR02147 family)
MNDLAIFEYDDYKAFLRSLIKANSLHRGYKAFLAKSAKCERSYFSQVINSKPQLTPDHAFNLSQALEMTDLEREYWLLLVEYGRSADLQYKRFLKQKIKKLQTQSEDLRNNSSTPPELTKKSEILYFSKWYMVAVHLLCDVIKSDQINKIAMKLNLPHNIILDSLNELVELNLLVKKNENWKPTKDMIYVHKSSPLCDVHHINWRQQAIYDVQRKKEESIHMTAVHSISLADFQKVKQILLSSVQSSSVLAQNSKEEVLACLNIDYFHF